MTKNQDKFTELVAEIELLFNDLEVKSMSRDIHLLDESVKKYFNDLDCYITLHDLQKLKPIFINEKMKNYYGFDSHTFKDIDYFYYFLTVHPSTYHTLLDSVVHFKNGGKGLLKLEYKLKNAKGKFEKFLGITKSIFYNDKAEFAISLLRKNTEINISDDDTNKELSKREIEITMLICKGMKQNEISNQLSISLETTKVHVRNIYKKLNINSSQELIILYKDYLD